MQLTSLKYLTRQGLAIRGHEIEGNLPQLLQCRAENVPVIYPHLAMEDTDTTEIKVSEKSKVSKPTTKF